MKTDPIGRGLSPLRILTIPHPVPLRRQVRLTHQDNSVG